MVTIDILGRVVLLPAVRQFQGKIKGLKYTALGKGQSGHRKEQCEAVAGADPAHCLPASLFCMTGSGLLTRASLQLRDDHVYGPEIADMEEAGLKPLFPLKPQIIAFKPVFNTTENLSRLLCSLTPNTSCLPGYQQLK